MAKSIGEDKCERKYSSTKCVCLCEQIAVARHVRGQQITSNYRNLRRNSLFSKNRGPRSKDQGPRTAVADAGHGHKT